MGGRDRGREEGTMQSYLRAGALAVVLLSVGVAVAAPRDLGARVANWVAALGGWAVPVFVVAHAVAIALCFPYAIGLEAAAGLLFGLPTGVACVVAAKALGASLTFWVGRTIFRNWAWARDLVRCNKYFNIVRRGVTKDGWRFVLLARFSPMPSYVVSYSLAATDVSFFKDYLLPTIAGGIPMIIQNTSLGTFTSVAALSTTSDGHKKLLRFLFPAVGLICGGLITWRIRKYTKQYDPNLETEMSELVAADGEKLSEFNESTSGGPADTEEQPRRALAREDEVRGNHDRKEGGPHTPHDSCVS